MTNETLDKTAMAAEMVALSADAGSRGPRPTWTNPEFAEIDIASVTLAGGPGVADSGILS